MPAPLPAQSAPDRITSSLMELGMCLMQLHEKANAVLLADPADRTCMRSVARDIARTADTCANAVFRSLIDHALNPPTVDELLEANEAHEAHQANEAPKRERNYTRPENAAGSVDRHSAANRDRHAADLTHDL